MTSDMKSDGIEIETEMGAPVRAIHEGRVQVSDWIGLRGQAVIIDHGNGYLSIYSHLGELYAPVGTRVAAGDTIGTAGMSGGRPRPGIFFQIRHAAGANQKYNAIDPRAWFRTPAPPAR